MYNFLKSIPLFIYKIRSRPSLFLPFLQNQTFCRFLKFFNPKWQCVRNYLCEPFNNILKFHNLIKKFPAPFIYFPKQLPVESVRWLGNFPLFINLSPASFRDHFTTQSELSPSKLFFPLFTSFLIFSTQNFLDLWKLALILIWFYPNWKLLGRIFKILRKFEISPFAEQTPVKSAEQEKQGVDPGSQNGQQPPAGGRIIDLLEKSID